MNMEVSLDTTLTTERLLLRPVDLSDVELVWEASRVDGFNDGMTWDPPASKEEIVEITHRNLAHWSQGKDYIFTVCLTASEISIGRVGLHKEEAPDTWNIGFWIHPDHWGNGYASEAARAVLQFGFDTLRAKRILTAHATWNIRSQRVIESLGFRYLQTNPAGFYKRGNPVEEYEYELNREL
jgi:ribosomal-protein-alanine N-acetyltransferase